MTSGDKLFGRLLGRSGALAAEVPTPPSAGLRVHLDAEGRVLHISGTLRNQLAAHAVSSPLHGLLCAHSAMAVEGVPADWQRHSLDLDFQGVAGQILHTRGTLEPHDNGWRLHAVDIGDLLGGRQLAEQREQNQQLISLINEQLRVCTLSRLPDVFNEQLSSVAQRWRIPCVALALLDQEDQGWRVYSQYANHDAPLFWHTGQRLSTCLDSLNGTTPLALKAPYGRGEHPRLHSVFGNADGFLVPYRDGQGVAAWLLCGAYNGQPHTRERDWLNLAAALAAPLLSRLREQRHHQQLERLEALQGLLGTGWWELLPASGEIQLAPQLMRNLGQEEQPTRLALDSWLNLIHPADRQELQSRLQDLHPCWPACA